MKQAWAPATVEAATWIIKGKEWRIVGTVELDYENRVVGKHPDAGAPVREVFLLERKGKAKK